MTGVVTPPPICKLMVNGRSFLGGELIFFVRQYSSTCDILYILVLSAYHFHEH